MIVNIEGRMQSTKDQAPTSSEEPNLKLQTEPVNPKQEPHPLAFETGSILGNWSLGLGCSGSRDLVARGGGVGFGRVLAFHLADEAEVEEIDRRLVDLARPAIGAEVRAIALTQCSEIKLR